MIVLKFKKISDLATIPTKKHESDAGYDLTSIEEATIPAKAQQVFHTGIEVADCPKDIVLKLWSRSGLASRYGIHVEAGVVDAGYRGEILICLSNNGTTEYTVKVGDKIAQLVPIKLPKIKVEEVTETQASQRGKQGGITEFKATEVEFLEGMPE